MVVAAIRTERYLGQLVQAEHSLAVGGAVATPVHQLLQLQGHLVVSGRYHGKGRQAAGGGRWRGRERERFGFSFMKFFSRDSEKKKKTPQDEEF